MCRSPGNGRGVSRRNVSLKLFELSFDKRLAEETNDIYVLVRRYKFEILPF